MFNSRFFFSSFLKSLKKLGLHPWAFFSGNVNTAQSVIHIFDYKTTQDLASKYCISLGGFMPSPSSKSQIEAIINSTNPQKVCSKEYWTPIVQSDDNLEWMTVDWSGRKSKAEYLPWNQGSTDIPDENCIIIDESLMFQTDKCLISHCFPCQFYQQVEAAFAYNC